MCAKGGTIHKTIKSHSIQQIENKHTSRELIWIMFKEVMFIKMLLFCFLQIQIITHLFPIPASHEGEEMFKWWRHVKYSCSQNKSPSHFLLLCRFTQNCRLYRLGTSRVAIRVHQFLTLRHTSTNILPADKSKISWHLTIPLFLLVWR